MPWLVPGLPNNANSGLAGLLAGSSGEHHGQRFTARLMLQSQRFSFIADFGIAKGGRRPAHRCAVKVPKFRMLGESLRSY